MRRGHMIGQARSQRICSCLFWTPGLSGIFCGRARCAMIRPSIGHCVGILSLNTRLDLNHTLSILWLCVVADVATLKFWSNAVLSEHQAEGLSGTLFDTSTIPLATVTTSLGDRDQQRFSRRKSTLIQGCRNGWAGAGIQRHCFRA